MIKSQARLSRRTFLLAATAGTAATAAALVGRKEETDTKTAADDSAQSSKGYQLTAHVQNYYRTAKL